MLDILVATDDLMTWEAFAAEIAGAGYTPHWAADGFDALQLAAEHAPQAVFLDLGITVVSAWECCESLRGDPDIPEDLSIYMLTDDAVNPYTIESKGATGVFSKTPRAGELADLLAALAAAQIR